ncbi:MAG: cytochrome c [Phycisphaeraceae bacterium]|nr:cytochrome c [Phycisphaeraceae bacterium]
MKSYTHIRTLIAAALAGAAALGGLSGCRGDREDAPPRQFFPDLDDQLKWRPQGKSDFFSDGRMMRPPVPGTVAFGRYGFVPDDEWPAFFRNQRDQLLKEDPAVYQGVGADGRFLDRIPADVTLAMLATGQEKYNIYCAVCHGFLGDGKGQVGLQWSYPLPNFHDEKYKKPDPNDASSQLHTDGYMFHIARVGLIGPDGVSKMPGYAHALDEGEAWSVVAYIRALQASREGSLSDVPEAMRPQLERSRSGGAAPAQGGVQ